MVEIMQMIKLWLKFLALTPQMCPKGQAFDFVNYFENWIFIWVIS